MLGEYSLDTVRLVVQLQSIMIPGSYVTYVRSILKVAITSESLNGVLCEDFSRFVSPSRHGIPARMSISKGKRETCICMRLKVNAYHDQGALVL